MISDSPRLSQATKTNFTGTLSDRVVICIEIDANPVPHPSNYSWQKCGRLCEPLNDYNSYAIASQDLMTNLTILNLQESDFGAFKLNVANGIGTTLTVDIQLRREGNEKNFVPKLKLT